MPGSYTEKEEEKQKSTHSLAHADGKKNEGSEERATRPPLASPHPLSHTLSPHRVLARPLPGRLLVPGPVRLVDVGDFGDERVVRVGVAQQGADGQEHLGQGQGGRPLLLQDVQADGALRVDVGVVDLLWGVCVCFLLGRERG